MSDRKDDVLPTMQNAVPDEQDRDQTTRRNKDHSIFTRAAWSARHQPAALPLSHHSPYKSLDLHTSSHNKTEPAHKKTRKQTEETPKSNARVRRMEQVPSVHPAEAESFTWPLPYYSGRSKHAGSVNSLQMSGDCPLRTRCHVHAGQFTVCKRPHLQDIGSTRRQLLRRWESC